MSYQASTSSPNVLLQLASVITAHICEVLTIFDEVESLEVDDGVQTLEILDCTGRREGARHEQ